MCLRRRRVKIKSCMGNLSPEGVMRVFGWVKTRRDGSKELDWNRLIDFCHANQIAFDVNQTHKYSKEYREILELYLKEPEPEELSTGLMEIWELCD